VTFALLVSKVMSEFGSRSRLAGDGMDPLLLLEST